MFSLKLVLCVCIFFVIGIEAEPKPKPKAEPKPQPKAEPKPYSPFWNPSYNRLVEIESEPACPRATTCKVGWQGDRACGPNSHCDRKQGVCVCNSPAQDYPNCCWPSCRGIDAVCINGGPCQCIGYGHYPNCQEVCGLGCGDGEICKKVGNKAMCVCKSNFYRRKSRDSQGPGVCIPCDYFGHDYRDYGDYPLPPAPGWE